MGVGLVVTVGSNFSFPFKPEGAKAHTLVIGPAILSKVPLDAQPAVYHDAARWRAPGRYRESICRGP